MLGRITDDTLEKVRKNFTLDEIAALQDPALTLPDTLPALTPVMRARTAETLKRAAGGEGRTSGDQGGGGRAGALRVVPEYAGPALELACAVTERVEATNPVHRLPLQAAISHLLGRADAARDLPGQEVERLALEIARDRKALEAKITLAKEIVARAPPPTMQWVKPERFMEEVFLHNLSGRGRYRNHPMQFNRVPMQKQYTAQVDGRVAGALKGGVEATRLERLAARATLLPGQPDGYVHVAAALVSALRLGHPRDAAGIARERQTIPAELAALRQPDIETAVPLLERLYRNFTLAEIAVLARPERALPGAMREIDGRLRSDIAAGIRTMMSKPVTRKFGFYAWGDGARHLEARLHPGRSMGRGEGMSLS